MTVPAALIHRMIFCVKTVDSKGDIAFEAGSISCDGIFQQFLIFSKLIIFFYRWNGYYPFLTGEIKLNLIIVIIIIEKQESKSDSPILIVPTIPR